LTPAWGPGFQAAARPLAVRPVWDKIALVMTSNPMRPRRLWLIVGAVAVAGLILAIYYFPPEPTLFNWLLDLIGLLVMYLGGLIIISQFVLPVQTLGDRRRVLEHFLGYGFGSRGPIIFVKEGKLVARKEELRAGEAGVALLDSSSALVLERGHAPRGYPLVRAVGPGVAFIQPGERIVAALDLRKQSRGGPVKALTKDGIEVNANVSVTFGISLDPPRPGQPRSGAPPVEPEMTERNRPAHLFDPERAFRAVYGLALGEKQPVPWTDLPAAVAAEAFRNIMAEYMLDSLFQPTVAAPNLYPYGDFQARVTQAVKEALVLRERGLIVFSVGVGVPRLPREVVNQRVRTWASRWQRAAFQRLATVDSQTTKTLGHWRARAQEQIFKDLLAALTEDPTQSRQALALLMARALQGAARDPATRKLLTPEQLSTLDSLQEWLK
jgi:hypothetical protein